MITYRDYELHPEPQATGRWELRRTYMGKTKEGQPRKAHRMLGCGLTFEGAMRTIAEDITQRDESITSLREYIQAFRTIKDEIVRECQP